MQGKVFVQSRALPSRIHVPAHTPTPPAALQRSRTTSSAPCRRQHEGRPHAASRPCRARRRMACSCTLQPLRVISTRSSDGAASTSSQDAADMPSTSVTVATLQQQQDQAQQRQQPATVGELIAPTPALGTCDEVCSTITPSELDTRGRHSNDVSTSSSAAEQEQQQQQHEQQQQQQLHAGSSALDLTFDDEVVFDEEQRQHSGVDENDTPEALADVQYSRMSQPSPGSSGATAEGPLDPFAEWWRNRDDLLTLGYAVSTGVVVATSVFFFDVSIQAVHDLPDIFSNDLHLGGGRATGLVLGGVAVPFRCIMPIGAGVIVAWLQSLGFSPALKFLTRAIEGVVDDKKNAALPKSYWQVFRKAAASVITLGSGASLGPEAPSVELGANTAAVFAPKHLSKRRQRMLVAAGAAAGVSAAFDAPVTGALFAVEFVLKSSRLGLDRLSTSTVFVSTSVAAGVIGFLRAKGQALGITGAATHLVGRIPYFSMQPNLLTDVLQYGVLGVGCAGAAVLLYEGVRLSELALRPLPRIISAPLGGALCGIIAFRFPQVQYGYVNLEEIFRDSTHLSVGDLLSLLLAKIAATSVCVGGGLVGGLFAPSLFLGALVGDVMGHFVALNWGVADPTTLVVVGAAAVLGASCRAPLTAIALMVEITRDTGLLVPLLAAIGVASLVSEYMEGLLSTKLESLLMQWYLQEKFHFWGWGTGAGSTTAQLAQEERDAPKTVQAVMATRASLYVRHTLPLEQARTAMAARTATAAVVVDDNFTPMGLVQLSDIEAELVKQQLLLEDDSNFNRRT